MAQRKSGFHHVAIRARDFDKSVRFYTEVLGLRAKIGWGAAPGRAIMLDVGDGDYVELFERPNAAADAPSESVLLHFALRTDDTKAAYERAVAWGCESWMAPKTVDIQNTVEGAPKVVPVHIAFVKGPDGELIEFFENEVT